MSNLNSAAPGCRSFRDPDGFVLISGGHVFRCIYPHAVDDFRAFLSSPLAVGWTDAGVIPSSRILQDPAASGAPPEFCRRLPEGSLAVEHQPIPFPNYPYEWAPEMLHTAGVLTLRLAREALSAGFTLKDATPYNVMFEGARPVFLDLLSFARRDPLDAVWPPYAQFVRTFLYPLWACRYSGLHLDEILLSHRDGLDPRRMLSLCPPHRRVLPPLLNSVLLPALLERCGRHNAPDRYRPRLARDAAESAFVLGRLLDQANSLLGAPPAPRRGAATLRYMESEHDYAPADFGRKERFVTEAFHRSPPVSVLDIGSNTGHFSRIAAAAGAAVVAIDRDPDAAGMLWRQSPGILPLAIDIARPPGASGWANLECASFLDRAQGKFDYVLLLALLHHLLVNERVPLAAILDLAAELTTRFAIVEYIDPADSQFQRIARGRDELHRGITRPAFETAARLRFQIIETGEVTPTRALYLLRKSGT